MNRRFSQKKYFILFLISLTIGGCATSGRNSGQVNIYSLNAEARLGSYVASQVPSQFPILHDPELTEYTNSLGQKLVGSIDDPLFDYQFRIIRSPQINAFALPGGYLYANLGLLHEAETEAELAGVLGHEIGHVVARHGTEQLTKAQGFSLCLAIGGAALGLTQTELELVNLFGQTGLLYYGRAAELEADRIGLEILYKTGYDQKD